MVVVVDREQHTVHVSKKKVKLAPREWTLMLLLQDAKGKVLSRDRILKDVFANDDSLDIRTIDQHIARLRRKIGKDKIETITNYGYRWNS